MLPLLLFFLIKISKGAGSIESIVKGESISHAVSIFSIAPVLLSHCKLKPDVLLSTLIVIGITARILSISLSLPGVQSSELRRFPDEFII